MASNWSPVELGNGKSIYDTPAVGRRVGCDDLHAGPKERQCNRQEEPRAIERFDRQHGEARPR
jgi:hypothetical protein